MFQYSRTGLSIPTELTFHPQISNSYFISHIFPRFQKQRLHWVFIWAICSLFISTWALPPISPIYIFLIFPITFPELWFVQWSLDLSPRYPFSEIFQHVVKHFENCLWSHWLEFLSAAPETTLVWGPALPASPSLIWTDICTLVQVHFWLQFLKLLLFFPK